MKHELFQGFHVENAVCGGCHTMVQARPIPGYLPTASEVEEAMSNGHEEVNVEARRRHRQEKLPPLSPEDLNNPADPEDPENPADPAEDTEKITTLSPEEASDEEGEAGGEKQSKPSRGQKISNFFKNLGKKKEVMEDGGDEAVEAAQETFTSPKNKKQVRFFGKASKKNDEIESKNGDETSDNEDDSDEESKKEDHKQNEEDKDDLEDDSDEVSSIEDAEATALSPKTSGSIEDEKLPKEVKKSQKRVTIQSQEDLRSSPEAVSSEAAGNGEKRKKSKACILL